MLRCLWFCHVIFRNQLSQDLTEFQSNSSFVGPCGALLGSFIRFKTNTDPWMILELGLLDLKIEKGFEFTLMV